MKVTAIGIRGNYIQKATNYNENECKNIPGQCGCIHAEIALLQKINPKILVVTHSPCLQCAKAIIKSDVEVLIYDKEYRIKDGLQLLKKHNIHVIQLKQKKVEKLTKQDLEELMNVHAPTYKRYKGAIRRR
jgi:deoxycytidylate deaminase